MRIAVGILGLALGMMVLMQSCAVTMGSDIVGDAKTSEAGGVGLIMGIMYFVGGAFAFGLPTVSLVIFSLTAVIGFTIAAVAFADLRVWAYAALVLAGLSLIARRAGRRADAPAKAEAPSK